MNKQKVVRLPNFTAELDGSNIKIVAENLKQLVIKYYKIDLEVFFSINPFTFSETREHANVMPFHESIIYTNRKEDWETIVISIQETLRHENLFI